MSKSTLKDEVKRVISEMKEGGTLGQVMATLKKSDKLSGMNLDECKSDIKKMIAEMQESDSDSSSSGSGSSGSSSSGSSDSGDGEEGEDEASDHTLGSKDFGEDEEQDEMSDQERMSEDGEDEADAINVDEQQVKRPKTDSDTFTLSRMTKFMKLAGIKLIKRSKDLDDETYRALVQKTLKEDHEVTSLDSNTVKQILAKNALNEFAAIGVDPNGPAHVRVCKRQALARLKKKVCIQLNHPRASFLWLHLPIRSSSRRSVHYFNLTCGFASSRCQGHYQCTSFVLVAF